METTAMIETLTELGGKVWEKNGMRRVYFNADLLARFYGLRVSRYNSGNVSSAILDGEKISNGSASEILRDLSSGKFWWDAADGKFHGQGLGDYFPAIVEAVKAKMAPPSEPVAEVR